MGAISGDVTARTGNAKVSALECYTGTVEAGQQAGVSTGDVVTGSIIKAGRNVRVSAHGSIDATQVTSGENADVLSDLYISAVTVDAGLAS